MDFKECGIKLNIDSFKEVESVLGGVFPGEYKAFMVNHNGGRPIDRLSFSFMDCDSETGKMFLNGSDIYSFNKLEDIPDFYDNLFSSDLIPEHFCPIADDSCGNELLLCLSDNTDYGSVFFADHEQFNEDESFKLTKIATDFKSFIQQLNCQEMCSQRIPKILESQISGKREVWNVNEEAKAYFLEMMMSTDGEDHERNAFICS